MPNTALALLDTVTEPAIAGGLSEFGIQEVGTLQFGTTRTLSRVGTCRAPATASTLGKQ